MSKSNSPIVSLINNELRTISTDVAAYFGKGHNVIMRQIRRLIANCSEEFTECNFALSEYTDSTGRKLPCYSMTKDGFTLLAMGFTGPKAMQFKLTYIEAFNRMEAELAANNRENFQLTSEQNCPLKSKPAKRRYLPTQDMVYTKLQELGSACNDTLCKATGLSYFQVRDALKGLTHKNLVVADKRALTPYGHRVIYSVPSSKGEGASPQGQRPAAIHNQPLQPAPFALNNIISDQERYDIHQRLDKLELARKELYVQLRDTVGLVRRYAMDVEILAKERDSDSLYWLADLIDPQVSSRWNGFDSSMFSEIDLVMKHCKSSVRLLANAKTNYSSRTLA